MLMASISLREDYWETFSLQDEDIEFLYNYLLELETPLTTKELVSALVNERVQRELQALEQQRNSAGDTYFPKNEYVLQQKIIFPALSWQRGEVIASRASHNPDMPPFEVIRVRLDSGEEREFASRLEDHILNNPLPVAIDDEMLDSN
jgi:hypothetical protein